MACLKNVSHSSTSRRAWAGTTGAQAVYGGAIANLIPGPIECRDHSKAGMPAGLTSILQAGNRR